MVANGKLYFTKKGVEKLELKIKRDEESLEQLQAKTAEVAETGGNQWHDNASFEKLTEDMRGLRHRISAAKESLRYALVVDPPDNCEYVAIGASVKVMVNHHEETWTIAGYGESDFDQNIIAYNAPLATLIMGKRTGDVVSGKAGRRHVEVKILDIGGAEDVCGT